ncbi:MAG TPA: M12 family metallo-peptidase, partial [Saprospiraceae bacterium]|nr:M12 family metallo-peptidase [Saprospiraceae bacterium]
MTVRLRLFSLLCVLFFFVAQLQAQIFNGTPNTVSSTALDDRFTSCEVYQFDVAAFNEWVKNTPEFSQSEIHLGNRHWKLELVPSGLMADYTLQVLTPQGLEVSKPANKAFNGYEKNAGGRVALTVDEDFMSGLVYEGSEIWYIEPYRNYEPSASVNQFVVYERNAVIRDNFNGTCIALEAEGKMKEMQFDEHHDEEGEASKMQACYQADIALAADKSMFTKYGSVGAVEDHNIAVLNDVQTNYVGSFNHDIMFNIVTQFVVTGTDPWTTSNDAGTLLGSFRTWGNAGNFGVSFDVASLWTNRDFTGSTIGIAYIAGVCNSNKYNCLQDFSSNSELLRCLQAHELGHNFSASHDNCPTGVFYIMCPFVSTSNDWSSTSVSQINAFIAPLVGNCLASCGPPPPPLVADFTWEPDPGCQGQPVQFTDQSTGNITSRTWTFPGGSPTTSTQTNPVVTWNNPGTYNVKLTLTGAGGPVSTTKPVTIQANPVANFTFTVNGLTVLFNSTSTNADTYFWDFGD